MMLRIGLTGGIASGKSTVAALLRDRDCPVLDADVLTHELLEPGQAAYDEVLREFGPGILTSSKTVDRRKLGAIVFADSARRARLNQHSAGSQELVFRARALRGARVCL